MNETAAMVAGDPSRIVVDVDPLIRDLVSEYLANRRNDLFEIRAALEGGDFERISRLAHNMHGSGGSFGFGDVSIIGGELERAASTGDRAAMTTLLERLEDYLTRVEVVTVGRSGDRPAIAPESGSDRRNIHGAAAQILVVDDQEMNAAIISRYLAREGFAVKHVASGDEALALLDAGSRPALILLDVLMPGTNGFEVCRRIKSNARTHFIPVMLVTSLDGGNDRIRGWAAGADDIVPKPVRREELVMRIRSLVRSLVPSV
jgi:CheY-like chemotaxis protein